MEKTSTLSENPTVTEKVYYLENEFEQISKFSVFNKIVKNFLKNPSEFTFEGIQVFLNEIINFDSLNNNGIVTFYLMDDDGKIIISNVGNIFSTYDGYVNNTTYFYNLSEEQGFLNYQFELENDGKIGTNLLETPIANLLVNGLDNPLGFLYFLIGQKNICPGYKLLAFVYTLSLN